MILSLSQDIWTKFHGNSYTNGTNKSLNVSKQTDNSSFSTNVMFVPLYDV